ncbi:MAG: FAD-binding oxidoreductase [Myxococcota bacterium]|nr:FAD-binding oxidoreductase [Myxococcota bacterium]
MSDVLERLRAELGARVRTDAESRNAHRRDSWVLEELHDLEGRPPPPPLAVVCAESTADVASALRICRETRTPVVPFGGGSGVCGGIHVQEDSVVVSTRAMQGLVEFDRRDLVASFRAGTLGIDAEQRLQREGLTIGHWPQSIESSTVGGWVATRASGQFSTAYGSIEDLVFALEAVLPDGSVIRTRQTPRASAGPDLRQIFLGSEGTLGIVTEVSFSLRPLPEARRGQTQVFEDFASGLEAIRSFMAAGWRPPVVRLYDEAETRRNFADACPEGNALLLLHEGPAAAVEVELPAVAAFCAAAGARPGAAALVDDWLEHRNQVPGFRGFLEKGIVLDTIEVAATWGRVTDLYERVTRSISELPGVLAATAHSSHSYRSGTNLYFTFAVRPSERGEMERVYLECWRRTLRETVAVGGGIAHHHGIGRVRREALASELGASGVTLLRTLKRALDPDGLLNPGVLLPDAPEPS